MAPLPAAQPLPTPAALAPDAPPQIIAVKLSDMTFHSGETITGTVVTSTNVSSVTVTVLGHTAAVPQTSAGVFTMTQKIPTIPFFMRGTYTAEVVALTASGQRAEQNVTVSVV